MTSQLIIKPNQYDHYLRVREILRREHSYIDTSDVGYGKTYIAMAIAVEFKLSIIVVAPVIAISMWEKKCKEHGINLIKSMTYDSLRGTKLLPPKHGFLVQTNKQSKNKINDNNVKYYPTKLFDDCVKSGVLLVFDECHKLKNPTLQTKAAHALVKRLVKINSNSRIALLAAIPNDKELCVENIMKIMGIIQHNKLYKYDQTTRRYNLLGLNDLINKCKQYEPDNTLSIVNRIVIDKKTAPMVCYDLYTKIIKKYCTSAVPKINSKLLDEKNGYYDIPLESIILLKKGIMLLKDSVEYDDLTGLVKLIDNKLDLKSWNNFMRSGMIFERAKVPTLVRLAKQQLNSDDHCKVLLYFNHIKSIYKAAEDLKEFNPMVMYGKTPKKMRDEIIEKFQKPTNECRLIIANPTVAGISVSLDDCDGNWPRFLFIVPSFKFIDLYQTTGRVHRPPTTKSTATVRFVYSKLFPCETNIIESLNRKAKIARGMIYDDAGTNFPGEYEKYIEGPTTNIDLFNNITKEPIDVNIDELCEEYEIIDDISTCDN